MIGDIDWRVGTVLLGARSRCDRTTAIAMETGQALADYLQHERPSTSNPAVFVRQKEGHDHPITSAAIQKVILHACRRAGLMHSSAHALRHTWACRLVENGSSLKEVADVLRHHSLNTTLIYAKLDTPKLSTVPRPWPGSGSLRAHQPAGKNRRLSCRAATSRLRYAPGIRSWPDSPVMLPTGINRGPLTADLMLDWARQDRLHRETPSTWAIRLAKVRHFARYLKQFERIPKCRKERVFGPEPGRVAPHIFHEDENRRIAGSGPSARTQGSIRPAHLRNPVRPDGFDRSARLGSHSPARADVDLKQWDLTKFGRPSSPSHASCLFIRVP